MAAEREPPTATDYVVTALSPVLIMLMVGSLVFFLVEVLYEGKYSGRLLYTLFFFVFGAVLVARIAIQADAARATGYGLILGFVTYLALLSYVEYPGGWLKSFGWLVNLGLLVLIWWSAHRLTWDCTHIDEKRKGAGRGLLSAAGLDADEAEQTAESEGAASGSPKHGQPKRREKPAKKSRHDSRLWNWIDKYQQHRERQRQGPNTPGVWVIYFALAALPIFALGQSLIDPGDDARRQASFLQIVVYIGSALALLVTTTFLALRRYLRQRKAKVPATLTVSWLGFGALLIVVFLTLGAFLPRPHSEVPWFGITRAGKSDREASRYALNKSSAGKGEGARGETTQAGDGGAAGKNGKPGGGGKGEKGSGGKGGGEKGSGGKGKGGKSQSGKSSSDQDGKSPGKSESQGAQGSGEDKNGEKEDDKANEDNSDRDGQTERDSDEAKDSSSDKDGGSRDMASSSQLGAVTQMIARVLKWIVFAVVAVLIVVAVILGILRFLAPFTDWAQRMLEALQAWWAGLWGARGSREKSVTPDALPAGPLRPPPFHEFSNPFTDGSADRRTPAELAAYTFAALDSWAWDRDCGRAPTETPLEFALRLGESFPELSEVLSPFATIYARLTYSELPPADDTLASLEQTWEALIHGFIVA